MPVKKNQRQRLNLKDRIEMMRDHNELKESDNNRSIEQKILKVLIENMKQRNTKENISVLKDQISIVKRMLGINKGVAGHANLQSEVLRIQNRMEMSTP
jgi:hypothetical protein